MAVVKKATYSGQSKTDVLNGKIRIEDGENRIVIYDEDNLRIIIGLLPDGTYGFVMSKEGYDLIDVFS